MDVEVGGGNTVAKVRGNGFESLPPVATGTGGPLVNQNPPYTQTMQPIPIPVSLALSASSSIAGDDDDYSDDEAAFFNQPVPRSQLYAPPQPSTTSPPDSIGKGKGKAKDDAAETDEPGTNTAQESEARSKAERDEKELSDAGERNAALRKQLEALEAVDDHTIKRLIDVSSLSLVSLSLSATFPC